jgi:hypothetical protein
MMLVTGQPRPGLAPAMTGGVAMDRPDFSAGGRQRATAIVTGPRSAATAPREAT